MPGAGRTRRPCGLKRESAHKSVQAGRNDPALPAQWLYGLLPALPGVPGLLAPSRTDHLCSLDPSVGGCQRRFPKFAPIAAIYSANFESKGAGQTSIRVPLSI